MNDQLQQFAADTNAPMQTTTIALELSVQDESRQGNESGSARRRVRVKHNATQSENAPILQRLPFLFTSLAYTFGPLDGFGAPCLSGFAEGDS